MRFVTFAAIVVSLFVASTGSAATYYVATTGSDSNAGTLAAPFKTLTRAASAVKPGDVVEVRGGVYNAIANLYNSKGTSAARIIFRNYAGETPIIDGSGMALHTDLVRLSESHYTDFSGFEVRNSTGLGITVWNAKGVRVLNNRVHHSERNGIYVGSEPFGATADVVVEGNHVYNNVQDNRHHTRSGGWGQAIGVDGANRVTISSNRIYENDGEGIAFVGSDNAVAIGNTVYDNYSVGIYFDNAQWCTADANFVYSTGNTRYFRDGFPAAGIGFANEIYSVANLLTDNRVTNNIVVNARWSLFYGGYDAGGGLKNTLISNNTFYKASTAILSIDPDVHLGNIVQNNIFFQNGGGQMLLGVATGSVFRNNLWYGGNAGAAAGAGDIIGDPLLVNAGGLTPTDYKLKPLSPAIHTAIDFSSVGTDFFGGQRSPTYDIGAHEQSLALGSGAAAAVASVEPPSNLTATAISTNEVQLRWTGSATAEYYIIFRDGEQVGIMSMGSFRESGRLPQTRYMYEVVAVDRAGTHSRRIAAYVTTPAAPADAQSPTAPASLRGSATTSTSITLTWSPATDDVNVTGYRIYRDGLHIATSTITEFADQGLSAGKPYTYHVVAMDAAGNLSAGSNTVTVTISSGPAKRRAART